MVSVGHKGEVCRFVIEGEMVLVATCGFGGCGYTEIAVFPDMAGVVRDGLRLVCLDRHFVCYSILAGVAHGVRAGSESSVKPEIGFRGALNGRGVCRIVFEFRSNIVAGVLYQRSVVHPQAVAGGPIEVQARAVVVGGGARRRGFFNKAGQSLGARLLFVLFIRGVFACAASKE